MDPSHIKLSHSLLSFGWYYFVNRARIAIYPCSAITGMFACDLEIFNRMRRRVDDRKVSHHHIIEAALAPFKLKPDSIQRNLSRRSRGDGRALERIC